MEVESQRAALDHVADQPLAAVQRVLQAMIRASSGGQRDLD